MGRVLSGTMNSILAATNREIDYTLLLTFPDASVFRFATGVEPNGDEIVVAGDMYTNDLESVSEIRQTMESPADRVALAIQNKDRVLGLHVAEHYQKWRTAEAKIGRLYRDRDNLGLSAWTEMFRGAVQQPNANDLQVTFDVIPDTLTPGDIICNQTLALPCWFVFKDPTTCGYAGAETLCDHHLKGNCTDYENTQRFGGMEHYYNPDTKPPASGGGGGGGGGGYCPRLDQYVRVKGPDGKPMARMVCFFTEQDELWNPRTRTFRKTRSTYIMKDQPIWELVAANGAVGYSSFTHPIIRSEADSKGRAVWKFKPNEQILTEIAGHLAAANAILSRDTGETGDVMLIEMEGVRPEEKIYCYGDSEDKMIVCHNSKIPDDPI